jgi:hypothetical protein
MPELEPQIGCASQGPPERRRYPRMRCCVPIELRPVNSNFPLQGETTDLSLGGCYVATTFPLAAGTEIEVRCWIGETRIGCRGRVCTSDPGVGNGIRFCDLDGLSRDSLSNYLSSLESSRCSEANEPTGVIHPHV